jgi:signal transduction histidine kinase
MAAARRGGWAALAVLLALFGGLAVAASYGQEYLPDGVAEALGKNGLRVALAVVSFSLLLFAVIRSVRDRRTRHALEGEQERAAKLEKRLQEGTSLTKAFRRLSGPLDENQALEAVVRASKELADSRSAALMLLESDRPFLRTRAVVGAEPGTDVRLGTGPFGRVAETRAPELFNGGSLLVVPLVAGGELVGVLSVEADERAFGQDELRVLALFADQAGLAIANTRAFSRERSSAERLAEMDRLKSEFVAMITHELKTPLTSLLGYSTLLRKRADSLPKKQRNEFHAIIARQGERILRLIDELLQSSRIEAAERLPREPVDLPRIVREVSRELSEARGRTINVKAPRGRMGLYGDPISMEHVVTNLLDNALKYSPKNTDVEVRLEEHGAEVWLAVSDRGPGITSEDLPHVFERFWRSDAAPRSRGAVGLGLFIAKVLVDAHGGRIWAESDPGAGATFHVALPRRRDDSEGAEKSSGVLDEVAEVSKETPRFGSVDDPMVERQR